MKRKENQPIKDTNYCNVCYWILHS